MALLTQQQVEDGLAGLPGWSSDEGALTKTYQVASFTHGTVFIGAIAQLAEAAGHHPDVHLHDYNQVTVRLVTHSAGGVTDKDLDLATEIEALPHKKAKALT